MADVSRETPSVPDAGRRAFPSERLALAERYADLLATEGVLRGLIGPREAPRLWDRHLVNSALLASLVPEGATVCDIGSGAGLPGIPLALARPDVEMTLVEPLLRRTVFLGEVVEELELVNVEVVRGRAEALHGRRTFEIVTARAVAPLPRLLDWSMPLVMATGALLAIKGSTAAEEVAESRAALDAWGCGEPRIERLGADRGLSPTTVVRVAWADPSRVSLPLATHSGVRRSQDHDRPKVRRRRRS